jgi:hypothetical protein
LGGECGIGGMRNAEFALLLVEGVSFGQDVLDRINRIFRINRILVRM